MKKFMHKFKFWLLINFLKYLLNNKCPSVIPLSGEEAIKNNCFSVRIRVKSQYRYLLMSIDGEKVCARAWNGYKYVVPAKIHARKFKPEEIEIDQFYLGSHVRYESYNEAFFSILTRYTHLRLRVLLLMRLTSQLFFNKKSPFLKKREDLLKKLVELNLNNPSKTFTSFELMGLFYTTKWLNHPDAGLERVRLEIYLDSFVESCELSRNNQEYSVEPKSLITLESYNESERKHKEQIRVQFFLVIFTALLALKPIEELSQKIFLYFGNLF